jgi:virulence-associated protein VapD
MTTSTDFKFDGGMTVTNYKPQWKQAYDDAKQALEDFEGFDQAVKWPST